jgi:jumonji domain-containing protein 7
MMMMMMLVVVVVDLFRFLFFHLAYFVGEFIDVISKKVVSHGVYYIQKQNNNFQTEFNDSMLWSDVPRNIEQWGVEVFGTEPDAINLWMGDDNAYSCLHKDHYENFYCVLKGQKNFTLLPATDLYYLDQKEYQSGM